MCGNSHNSSGSVSHHNVVGDENRNFLTVNRIDGAYSRKLNTCFFLHKLGSLELCLLGTLFPVLFNLIKVRKPLLVFINKRMLGSHYHKGNAEKRIAPCRIYLQLLINVLELKINECTFAPSDPVNLLLLHIFREINSIKSFKKLVGIIRYTKIPDTLFLLDNIAVAHITFAALTILIGKDHFTVRTVIDKCICSKHQSLFKQFQEYPLCPLVIVGITCGKVSVPIKRKSDSF